MQVEEAIAFAVEQEEPPGLEIRINFGVFAGRDATTAELEELGKLLVPEAGEVSIVGEERHDITEDVEVVLHQVRVAIPTEALPTDRTERTGFRDRLVTLAEIWARQCFKERHSEISEL
jgi:hypothetical protein